MSRDQVLMAKGSTRDLMLDVGRRVFLERGYNHAGIECILQAAGVPKGSFYHYFHSKEDFGIEVLNRFAVEIDGELDRFLGDAGLPPLERMRRFGEALLGRLETRQGRCGCLVGNLSQEMADQSEAFRTRLESIFQGWTERFAACLREAQAGGDLSEEVDAGELAGFWIGGWQGALLRAKTARSPEPLRSFLNLMFGYVFRKAEPDRRGVAPESGWHTN